MGKLTTKARKNMPQSEFALPGKRYPVNDRAHAANAKARATQAHDKGLLSSSQLSTVNAAANKVLGKGKKKTS